MPRGHRGWQLPVSYLALFGGTAVVLFLYFKWSDGHLPWFVRILTLVMSTSIGYLFGRELGGSREGRPGPNWSAIGVALVTGGLASYFVILLPAAHDRERDEAFAALLADGRAATEALATVARDTPEPDAGRSVTEELRERHLAATYQFLYWLDRYGDEWRRFTPDQKQQLHDEYTRLNENNTLASNKLAGFKAKPKKE